MPFHLKAIYCQYHWLDTEPNLTPMQHVSSAYLYLTNVRGFEEKAARGGRPVMAARGAGPAQCARAGERHYVDTTRSEQCADRERHGRVTIYANITDLCCFNQWLVPITKQ